MTTCSKPLWTSAIVALIIQQFSLLILASYASLETIGQYAIALKISLSMSFILFSFNAVVAPKFATYFENKSYHKLLSLIKVNNRVLSTIAFMVTLLVITLANPLLAIFGEQYTEGVLILQILAIGQFVNIATGSSVSLLIMTGHEKLHQRNTIFVAIFTLIVAFLLIPLYGIVGAAITTSLSMSVQNLLSFYFARKYITSDVKRKIQANNVLS